MKRFDTTGSRKPGLVNITSLIDVIFMLVVFFMIGASFEKPAITVSLPGASSGEPVQKQTLVITIDAGGAVYLDGKAIETAALLSGLTQYRGGDAGVSLECDGSLSFQKVIEVMDIVKQAGVRNVSIRHDNR
jgi:biopolymer transport protein ExbD